MTKRKVCVVVTARPSYSRIKSALEAIRDSDDLELQLVVAASILLDRYGKAVRYVEEDGFEIAAKVYMVVEGENLVTSAKTTGLGLVELSTVFDNLRPDVVVTIADRYETLATSVAAAYMHIPLAHVQGGEVTGSIDEKVRHANTKLADIHFACSRRAAEFLVRMGEDPDMVFMTGCPSIDLAAEVLQRPGLDFHPFEKYGGVGGNFDPSEAYLVVLQHPVTDEYKLARAHIEETLYAIQALAMPTFWFWPNVDGGSDGTSNGIRAFREFESLPNVHFFKNMEPYDFLRLIYNGHCLIGNSSVAIREASFLGVPAVNIGTRQADRERGHNVLDVSYSRDEIVRAIRTQLRMGGRSEPTQIYGEGNSGKRIAEILASVDLRTAKRLNYIQQGLPSLA